MQLEFVVLVCPGEETMGELTGEGALKVKRTVKKLKRMFSKNVVLVLSSDWFESLATAEILAHNLKARLAVHPDLFSKLNSLGISKALQMIDFWETSAEVMIVVVPKEFLKWFSETYSSTRLEMLLEGDSDPKPGEAWVIDCLEKTLQTLHLRKTSKR